jgi:uncharacterized repeat protein (TIGR03843 family)
MNAAHLLATGDVEVLGLLPYSSNYTFLARVRTDEDEVHAVYKPRRGERPLWDFPQGSLAQREVAAFLVSESAGWGIVPTTVLREDAPLGPGSLQLFVEHDPNRHFFVFEEEGRDEELMVFALFDAVINNADRKGGHVIEDDSGRLWAVDHGVTFHVEPKLRTVVWAFAETELPGRLLDDLRALGPRLGAAGLEVLLSRDEIEATLARIDALVSSARFPAPSVSYPLPWPLI